FERRRTRIDVLALRPDQGRMGSPQPITSLAKFDLTTVVSPLRKSEWIFPRFLWACVANRLSGALVDHAVLHHEINFFERGDISQWISRNRHNVGQLAGFDRAYLVLDVHERGCIRGC